MLFPTNSKPLVYVPFQGLNPGTQVVRLFEDHQHDNRIYVVQEQYGSYYCGRTDVSAMYGERHFIIDTTKLRPATIEEQVAHCRICADDDLEVSVLWGG